jgi:hypothetical protein
MTLHQSIAGLCSLWIVIASSAASAQPTTEAVSTLQIPGIEGKWEPFRHVVTEARPPAPDAMRSTRDVFGLGLEGRPRLAEKIESSQQTAPDGRTTVVRSAWTRDLDGRLRLSYQQIEEGRVVAPDNRESVVTILLPDPDRRLREVQRIEYSARQTGPNVTRHDTTQLVRDVNGRWRVGETRSLVVRGIGPSEWIEEETIQLPGYDARLGPSVRVRTSTVAAADGGRNTVEEVEALNPAAPTEPFRVTRRTVIAVRRIGPDRWATERQVFVRDVNGRMRASQTETEESTAP